MQGRMYSQEERDFIAAYAVGHSYKEIQEAFNKKFLTDVSIGQIKSYMGNHKIVTGKTGRFEKGHIPANKGTHIGGWEPTQFKKGRISENHKPVGTISVRHNRKRGQKYVYVKVAEPNKWRPLHVVEWEKHNGPVPEGKIVIFLDGDVLNTQIENLTLVSRSVHARLNQMGLRTKDPEYTKTAVRVAELAAKIGEAKRRKT